MKRNRSGTGNTSADDVISQLEDNQFVLLQGCAGTGKSRTIKALYDYYQEEYQDGVYVCVSTGMAALNLVNIGIPTAKTIHSCFHLKIEPTPNPSAATLRAAADCIILILDEVGTVGATLFSTLGVILGGRVKVILVGDFLQMAPINDGYCFQSDHWPSQLVCLRLRHNYRQKNDPFFAKQLQLVRRGAFDQINREIFRARVHSSPPDDICRLFAYRRAVDAYNCKRMDMLTTEEIFFTAEISIEQEKENVTISRIDRIAAQNKLNNRETLFKQMPVDDVLRVKIGSVVMFRRNALLAGIANGSTGKVTATTPNTITVDFGGYIYPVKRTTFSLSVGTTARINVTHFPLIIAFGMTIHKSQGTTMDRVVLDTNTFADGQLYVGLSRVCTLAGLYLTHPLPKVWRCHPAHVARMEADDGVAALCLVLSQIKGCDVRNMANRIVSYL
jgi:ATP-dependent DNA helicase PIF1